jgi:hypothetical protein
MRSQSFLRAWLAAALLAAPGCITLEDLPMPKDGGQDTPAEGEPDEIVSEGDADSGSDEYPASEGDADVEAIETPDPSSDGGDVDAGLAGCTGARCREAGVVDANFVACPGTDCPAFDASSDSETVRPFVCQSHDQCGQARFCVDGACRDSFVCESHDQCRQGQVCEEGTCRAGIVCQRNDQCPQEQLCLAGACRPRCTADNACVVYQGPADRYIYQLAADENALYFSLPPPQELSGEYRGNGELWRMLPGQSPTLVSDQLGVDPTFVVQAGYAYFRHGAATLMRSSVEPDAPDQQLYAIPVAEQASWAVGTGFVVFSGYDGFRVGSLDGATPLRHIEHQLSLVSGLTTTGDRFYFTAKTRTPDDFEFTRVKSVRAIEPFAIEDASPPYYAGQGGPELREVRGNYAYFGYAIGLPSRINLTDGSNEDLARFSHSGDFTWSQVSFSLLGDWLYFFEEAREGPSSYVGPASARVMRRLLSDPTRTQEVVPWRPAAESSAGYYMALSRDRLYTARSQKNGVIYEMALPAAP